MKILTLEEMNAVSGGAGHCKKSKYAHGKNSNKNSNKGSMKYSNKGSNKHSNKNSYKAFSEE